MGDNMKKTVIFLGCVVVLGVITACCWDKISLFYSKNLTLKSSGVLEDDSSVDFLKTSRDIPENADFSSYLNSALSHENGDFDQMAFYLEKVLLSDPENLEVVHKLYHIYGMLGRVDKMLEKSLNYQNIGLFFSNYLPVIQAIEKGDYKKALDSYNQYKKADYDLTLNPLIKAWIYVGLDDENNALKSLDLLNNVVYFGEIAQYHRAIILDYFGHVTEAHKIYDQYDGKKYPSLSVLVSMREFYLRQGEWNKTNKLYAKTQEVLKDNTVLFDVLRQTNPKAIKEPIEGIAEVFYSFAFILQDMNKDEVSIISNNIALYLNPNAVLYQVWGAELFEKMELYKYAEKMYDKMKPMTDIVLFKKGQLFLSAFDLDRAEKVFLDLETRNSFNPLILRLLAEVYQLKNDCEKAVQYYTKTLYVLEKLDTGISMGDIYFERGVCFLKLGLFKRFSSDLMVHLKENPDNPDALNYVAYEWLQRDMNIEEATLFAKKAHELMPDSPEIMDTLALAYYKKKDYKNALTLAEAAVDMLSGSSEVNMRLGDIYKALNRKREAKSQYKKALDLKLDLTDELKEKIEAKLEDF